MPFHEPTSEVIHHRICYIQLVTQTNPNAIQEDITSGASIRGQRLLGAILEMGYLHSSHVPTTSLQPHKTGK